MLLVRLPELKLKRERELCRKILPSEIAKSTGISPSTIFRLLQPTPKRAIEHGISAALCTYFGCTPNELLEYIPDE
jgi:DNA-binding Xre family transcriptional regulator